LRPIKTSGLFDAVVAFDAVTLDPATGEMKPEDRSCVPSALSAHIDSHAAF
jgi:hypothetical protein